MVNLHPISTLSNNSTCSNNSDQSSPSSSSSSSSTAIDTDNHSSMIIPPPRLPHLLYHYPPSSSSSSTSLTTPATTFPSTMEMIPMFSSTSTSPHLYHPYYNNNYYNLNNNNHNYSYPFPNIQNPPPFYSYYYYYYFYPPTTTLLSSQPIISHHHNADDVSQLVPSFDVDVQLPLPLPPPPPTSAGAYKQKSMSGNSEQKHATGSHPPLPPPSSSSYLADSTTVMVKNIPNSLSRRALIDLLDRHCREHNHKVSQNSCQYNFLYLPIDFQSQQNVGYAFVNFTSVEGAATLYKSWNGMGWTSSSSKIRQITRARLQGLDKCKRHYHLSSFFCRSEEYLPVEFSPPRDGFNGDACTLITIGKWFNRGNVAKSSRAKRSLPPRLSH